MIKFIPSVFSASFVTNTYLAHSIAGTAQNRTALEISKLDGNMKDKDPAVQVTISNEAKALYAQMIAKSMRD